MEVTNSKYKPKDFNEYRELILPAFQYARETIEEHQAGHICYELKDYWDNLPDSPQNRWGREECDRLMQSVVKPYSSLSFWAEETGLGPAHKYFSHTERGNKLRLDTIDMIIRTIKTWKS